MISSGKSELIDSQTDINKQAINIENELSNETVVKDKKSLETKLPKTKDVY